MFLAAVVEHRTMRQLGCHSFQAKIYLLGKLRETKLLIMTDSRNILHEAIDRLF